MTRLAQSETRTPQLWPLVGVDLTLDQYAALAAVRRGERPAPGRALDHIVYEGLVEPVDWAVDGDYRLTRWGRSAVVCLTTLEPEVTP